MTLHAAVRHRPLVSWTSPPAESRHPADTAAGPPLDSGTRRGHTERMTAIFRQVASALAGVRASGSAPSEEGPPQAASMSTSGNAKLGRFTLGRLRWATATTVRAASVDWKCSSTAECLALAFSVANLRGSREECSPMAEANSPGPGRSTSEAAFNDLKREIARRNEEAHKAARKKRAARDQERLAIKRKWERL